MNARLNQSSRVVLILALILLSGCYSTRKTTSFTDLKTAEDKKEPVRVLTDNSVLYTFNTFTFTDSTITGRGSVKMKDGTKNFEGTLKFSDILFIERYQLNYWQMLWIVPMAAAAWSGVSALLEPSRFELRRPVEGSCPFVYSYDGSEYRLEAEAFSTSVSKALEAETFHVLPALISINKELRVRISNERPETHLVNSVRLFAVDAEKSESVVLDTKNRAWPVYNAMTPVAARDRFGNNILDSVAKEDSRYWKSNLTDMTDDSGFQDTIMVQFNIPKAESQATLIISAINSNFVTEVYRSTGSILGDQRLLFYQALEQDPELRELVLYGIRRTSLLIEAATDNGWKKVGSLAPQADMVPFKRAIRLTNLDHFQRPLTLRLSSMTDVWHIDALSIDCSKDEPLTMYPLKMSSVTGTTHQQNIQAAVGNSDSLYAVILPPEHIDMTFDGRPPGKMKKPVYIFSAQGYLYEWLPEARDLSLSVIPSWIDGTDRITMLKYLIRHENLFLPQIYARWKSKAD